MSVYALQGLPGMGSAALTSRHPCSAPSASLDGDFTMFKKTLILMLTAAFLVAITGCNTVHGVGQDLEAAGEGIQDASE